MSLSVDRYELGPIGTNSYVVRASDDAREAVVIDPGDAERLVSALDQRRASCAAILITHGHWDHLVGVAALADATGAPVHMAADERMLLEGCRQQHHAGGKLRLLQLPEHVEAVHAGHADVQHEDVGIVLPHGPHGLLARAAPGQHGEILLGLQQALQPIEDERMIVGEYQGDRHVSDPPRAREG